MVAGLLGSLKAGGAYVPLDANTPAERLSYLLQDSAPKAVLIQERLQAKIAGAIEPERNLSVVSLDPGERDLANQPDVNPIPARSKTRLATASLSEGRPGELGLTSRALAYIIYTSGSTGRPKGVMVE